MNYSHALNLLIFQQWITAEYNAQFKIFKHFISFHYFLCSFSRHSYNVTFNTVAKGISHTVKNPCNLFLPTDQSNHIVWKRCLVPSACLWLGLPQFLNFILFSWEKRFRDKWNLFAWTTWILQTTLAGQNCTLLILITFWTQFAGKVNFVGSSHQWWHLFILLAYYWWHQSNIIYMKYRLKYQCSAYSEVTSSDQPSDYL